MSGFTFRLRAPPPQRVDLSGLTPRALNGRTAAEIAALPIHTTRAALSVGDLFDIREGDLDEIVFEGGAERLDRVGAGLGAGAIRVVGDVGVEAGEIDALKRPRAQGEGQPAHGINSLSR